MREERFARSPEIRKAGSSQVDCRDKQERMLDGIERHLTAMGVEHPRVNRTHNAGSGGSGSHPFGDGKNDDDEDEEKDEGEGELVFAVFHNKKGTGHVNVILGGEKEPGTWEGEVMDLPMVFDTGINKRWPNESTPRNKRKISNAFGSDKHSSVIFYKYVGGQDNKIYPGPTLKPVVIQGKRLGSGYLKPIGISGLQ